MRVGFCLMAGKSSDMEIPGQVDPCVYWQSTALPGASLPRAMWKHREWDQCFGWWCGRARIKSEQLLVNGRSWLDLTGRRRLDVVRLV